MKLKQSKLKMEWMDAIEMCARQTSTRDLARGDRGDARVCVRGDVSVENNV